MRHNYKNLKIWPPGIEIANAISDILLDFPKYERYNLSSQLSRCSLSIPSNIAEGSTFELNTQLILAKHQKYINKQTFNQLEKK